VNYTSQPLEEWPGQVRSTALLKVRESNAVRSMLLVAATFSLLRVIILPYVMHYAPAGTFTGPDAYEVVQNGLICFGVFALSAMLASAMPMVAVLFSVIVFAGLATYDLTTYAGWMETGATNKFVTATILLRAFMNAVLIKTS
jgi:hypothetical protein